MAGLGFFALMISAVFLIMRLESNGEVIAANAATQQKIELLRAEQRSRKERSSPDVKAYFAELDRRRAQQGNDPLGGGAMRPTPRPAVFPPNIEEMRKSGIEQKTIEALKKAHREIYGS